MNRIETKFNELKARDKKAFIVFITAGYPSLAVTERLIFELEKAGVDIIELGVPFSDPLADGPVIQEASQIALKNNTHLSDIINLVKKTRKAVGIPICLMSYYNPIFCFGGKKFAEKAKEAGIDGVILPDLPPDEDRPFIKLLDEADIKNICFISPTTSLKRIKLIAKIARGFIYYVSLTGVTGPRQGLAPDIKRNLEIIKRYTEKPVCAGFGISTPSQVKEVQEIADGVIVGSAVVKKIKDNIGKPDLIKEISRFIRQLRG